MSEDIFEKLPYQEWKINDDLMREILDYLTDRFSMYMYSDEHIKMELVQVSDYISIHQNYMFDFGSIKNRGAYRKLSLKIESNSIIMSVEYNIRKIINMKESHFESWIEGIKELEDDIESWYISRRDINQHRTDVDKIFNSI